MKRILITGANKGIGLALVERILRQHDESFVLLGARDAQRGDAARNSLIEQNPAWATRLMMVQIDVASDESTRAAADAIASAFAGEATPLYGIVNNAGIGLGASGLESVLAVNCYGIHRVCKLIGPLLQPKQGRIVNITSGSAPNFVCECSLEQQAFLQDASMSWEQLDAFMQMCIGLDGDTSAFASKGLSDGDPYGLSKACANTYTLILARKNPDLRINACTPGFIETDLTRPYAEAQNMAPAEMGMKPPSEGTASALYLLFGDVTESGHYYGSDALRSPLDRYRVPGSPAYTGT